MLRTRTVEAQVERPRILGWGPKKGGVEFINFPFGPFGSEICSEQLLESGLGSKRANTDRAVDPELKNREISFLTRILGRMTPICIF